MKAFLSGSAPVLILGGTPAGVVCAEVLARHSIPVTLVGEGRPFGGRGRSLPGHGIPMPAWPFGFASIPVERPGEVAHLLAQAHSTGACVQPDSQLRRVEFDGERVTEVVLEGILGEVRRRPRFLVVASRADHFLARCVNFRHQEVMTKELQGVFYDGAVFHLSWPELSGTYEGDTALIEVSGWRCALLSSRSGSRKGLHWACAPIDPSEPLAVGGVQHLYSSLLEAGGVSGKDMFTSPTVTTRIIQDAVYQPEGTTRSGGLKGLDSRWENVAFVGQGGSFVSMSVEEEIAVTRKRVQAWLA